VPFHRVMGRFMAQTGEPARFQRHRVFEIIQPEGGVFRRAVTARDRRHGARGDSVDTANSQFFFMFADGSSLNGSTP